MSQEALQACIRDEQTYQFTHFSHRDAWELGHALVSAPDSSSDTAMPSERPSPSRPSLSARQAMADALPPPAPSSR